jgi:hypothetical protein
MSEYLRAFEELRSFEELAAATRAENTACAKRLAALADILETRVAAHDAGNRELASLRVWSHVSAEVGATMHTSPGSASAQLTVAKALHDRLPRVAEVFATGTLSFPLVSIVVFRTALIKEAEALAEVDAEIATHCRDWARLPVARLEQTIDYVVDRCDPYALRRSMTAVRSRSVTVDFPDGTGTGAIWGTLRAEDAAALDKRLDAMIRTVCPRDPRDTDQRRADALGALAAGADRLTCGCGDHRCRAAGTRPSNVVVHVIVTAGSLFDDTDIQVSRARSTMGEAFWEPAPTGPTKGEPGLVLGGGLLPAPAPAELLRHATIQEIVQPGNGFSPRVCTPGPGP